VQERGIQSSVQSAMYKVHQAAYFQLAKCKS